MKYLRLLALLLLAACDNGTLNTGYWTRDPAAHVPAHAVFQVVDHPDAICTDTPGAYGCYHYDDMTDTGFMYVMASLEPPVFNCVASHEAMHYAGFRHDGGETPGVECAQGRR